MLKSLALYSLFIAIIVFWVAWVLQEWTGPAIFGEIPSLDKRGQWGDTFGALNALFAAAGFIAIVFTLRLQANDLRRQQIQINTAQIDQQQQRFERTFFELLHLLRDERLQLRFEHSEKYRTIGHMPTRASHVMAASPGRTPFAVKKRNMLEGRMAVRGAVKEVLFYVSKGKNSPYTEKSLLSSYIRHVHSRYESSLGPYFRLIYTLLYRIKHEKSLSSEDKTRYGNLLRSQLSSYEISLTALNALAPFSKDLKSLITEFRLLKYMPPGNLRESLEKIYPIEAFLPRD